jgi:hypothetical protein
MHVKHVTHNPATSSHLEYTAYLSGLGMAGNDIDTTIIESIKSLYYGQTPTRPISATAMPLKR